MTAHGKDGVLRSVKGTLVIEIDAATGVVVAMNRTAMDATGYGRDEVVGQPIFNTLMSPVAFGQAHVTHHPRSDASTGVPYEAPLLTKSGVERRVIWSNRWLHGTPGPAGRLMMSGLDISADSTQELVSHHHLPSAGTCWVGTDLEGRVTLWSDEAEQLLGYSRRDIIGRTLPLALLDAQQLHERAAQAGLPPDLGVFTADTKKFERRSSRGLDLGAFDRRNRGPGHETRRGTSHVPARPGGTAWTLIRKDGARVILAVAIKTIRNSSGEQTGFLGVGTDITAQQRSQDLLVSALQREADAGRRLRELDEAKDRLIATVSHELRTPLTSITGYTELLEDGLGGELSGQQRQHVDAIRRNTQRLSRLVEDLLALSGIEDGTLQSAQEELDLRDAVRHAWEGLELADASPRLVTSLELPSSPVVVRGDVAHLTRAVSNLLSNSVKCTEDAGSVSCVLLTDGDRATLRVTDTGFGIPIQEQAALFTRFFRTSTAQEREIPGSGLGLAIAMAVVRSCGGEIRVESEHLGGAVFTIDLPLADTDEGAMAAAS